MRKTIFTIAALLGFSFLTQAQFELKIQGGLNTSHLTSEHVKWSNKGRVGYQFGVSALVGEKFYVEPGLIWASSTKDLVEKGVEEQADLKTSISMMRVPVLLGYHILGSEKSIADLRVFVGPSASFVTGVTTDADQLSKDDFKNFIFDLDAGAAVDVLFFFLEWHYVFGLTPVFNEGSDAKLQAFYGNLGIRLRF